MQAPSFYAHLEMYDMIQYIVSICCCKCSLHAYFYSAQQYSSQLRITATVYLHLRDNLTQSENKRRWETTPKPETCNVCWQQTQTTGWPSWVPTSRSLRGDWLEESLPWNGEKEKLTPRKPKAEQMSKADTSLFPTGYAGHGHSTYWKQLTSDRLLHRCIQ